MSPLISQTVHGLNAFDCLSAMQKCIRRGLEREAMEFAVELGHTSKAFATMVTNRLQIVSHEDVGEPELIVLVATCCRQAREWYNPEQLGKWRMPVGTAIRAMCRAKKSREGDHFQAAVGLRSELEDYAPTVPDWAFDMHTLKGRRMGRGLDYFRTESTKLKPAPKRPDAYEAEAYRLWAIRDERKRTRKPRKSRGQDPTLF